MRGVRERWWLSDPSTFRRCGQMITQDDLDNWFTYHSPSPEQIPRYQAIRDAGRNLATVILNNTNGSPDQSDAIRSVRNACMTANAAIACEGN